MEQTQTMFNQHDNWLAERLGKFTASEIHRLMKSGRSKAQMFGDGATTYINEKIAERLTGQAIEVPQVNAMLHGQANEHEAIQALQEYMPYLSIEYYGGSTPVFYPYGKNAGGSPDGLTDDYVIEVKCPYNSAKHVAFLMASRMEYPAEWLKENSADYYAQVHLNMLATGRKSVLFVSYDPRMDKDNRLAVIEVMQDEEYTSDMKVRIEAAGKILDEAVKALTNH